MIKKILDEIIELEKNARIKLSPDERKTFIYDFSKFKNSLEDFDKIPFKDIEPIDFPFPVTVDTDYLREDIPQEASEDKRKKYLANSKNVKGDFFIIKK